MSTIETAKVLSNKLVKDKFNEGKQVRVLNVETQKGKESIWDKTINNLEYLRPNQHIEVIRDGKGKLTVLQRDNNFSNSNNTNESSYIDNDLGLPELMTDQQKLNLQKLIKERSKLLIYCIEVVREDLIEKDIEFHETTVKSLGVSLFIHCSRFTP